MSKLRIDEDFLEWWGKSLENQGYDLDEKQIRILAQPGKELYHVYSYHDFFDAIRKGEYWPSVAYHFAHQMYNQSRLEELAQREAEIILFPRKK
ncbi:MAG: hypothetical protein Q8R47_06515 [Nanoarchaeota archaeon]|nr:hypothetical protein [Nanoarchaeota archaeon]